MNSAEQPSERQSTAFSTNILSGLQALSSLPVELCDLLRSLHVHSLRNDEVLLPKDSRRSAQGRDPATQVDAGGLSTCFTECRGVSIIGSEAP